MAEGFAHWEGPALVLQVVIQPRASRDQIVGLQGDRLKIRITAPPVDGEANTYLLRYVAKEFKVPRSAVTLLRGETGRQKTLRIESPGRLPEWATPPPRPGP